jgi:ribosome maturation factor RimP
MKFRPADELGSQHLGRRVTVRRRLESGGFGDVIGILRAIDETHVVITDRNAIEVRIARADVVAARVIAGRE